MRPAILGLLAWLGLPSPRFRAARLRRKHADKAALTPSPPGAKAYFVDLKDGATIGPTTTMHFGL